MENAVYLQGGQNDLDPEHSVQHAYLLYLPVSDAKKREFEIGANPKGFSLGWWGLGKETSFSGMVYYLLR